MSLTKCARNRSIAKLFAAKCEPTLWIQMVDEVIGDASCEQHSNNVACANTWQLNETLRTRHFTTIVECYCQVWIPKHLLCFMLHVYYVRMANQSTAFIRLSQNHCVTATTVTTKAVEHTKNYDTQKILIENWPFERDGRKKRRLTWTAQNTAMSSNPNFAIISLNSFRSTVDRVYTKSLIFFFFQFFFRRSRDGVYEVTSESQLNETYQFASTLNNRVDCRSILWIFSNHHTSIHGRLGLCMFGECVVCGKRRIVTRTKEMGKRKFGGTVNHNYRLCDNLLLTTTPTCICVSIEIPCNSYRCVRTPREYVNGLGARFYECILWVCVCVCRYISCISLRFEDWWSALPSIP